MASFILGAGERGIGVGEHLADVAQSGRTEQRIGAHVGDDVGVAVSGETGLAGAQPRVGRRVGHCVRDEEAVEEAVEAYGEERGHLRS